MRNLYTTEEMMHLRRTGPCVVVIGGGTGLSNLLRGLKLATHNITAVVAVSDDGGGSGSLREDLGMLPPGDIRNCLLALANTEPTLQQLLNYRFSDGSLAGQSFGNLFLAALNGISGSFERAVARMNEVLAVTGRVLPVSCADIRLEATFADGSITLGESRIFDAKKRKKCRITRVRLRPENPPPLPDVLDAIRNADLIVLGPGSLYTSVIPNLLVDGIANAVAAASGLKIYVCNVMTQEGETDGYTAYDHMRELLRHSRLDLVDLCLANNSYLPSYLLAQYAREGAEPTVVDAHLFEAKGIELVPKPLARAQGDFARHDALKLTYALLTLLHERCPRPEPLADTDRRRLTWLEEQLPQ